jgi:hypothetical protein
VTSPLEIQSHGPLVVRTNYWDLPAARAGKVVVSPNAGAFRLLLPEQLEDLIVPDLLPAKECVVSRGPWPAEGLADGTEILFDDRSESPFALHLTPESWTHLPIPEDAGREWVLSVWTRPRRGRPHKALERPCWYRLVPQIPCLLPRES